MKYLLQIYPAGSKEAGERLPPDEQQAIVEEDRAIGRSPEVIGGAALQPVETATTVRVQDGETLLTDGPFADHEGRDEQPVDGCTAPGWLPAPDRPDVVSPPARSEVRFETAPGFQAEVDWSHEEPIRTSTGLELPLHCLTWCSSTRATRSARRSARQHLVTSWSCHRRAFRHFGGVPRELLDDPPSPSGASTSAAR